ncbi:17013_t:CDS:1, partial [Acaulospora colombiana]
MHSNPVRKNTKKRGRVSILSSNEIDKTYQTYSFKYSRGLNHYAYDYSHEGRKRIVNRLIDSAKIIQQAWRAFKLRPETWAKQLWKKVRDDGHPNEKKIIG